MQSICRLSHSCLARGLCAALPGQTPAFRRIGTRCNRFQAALNASGPSRRVATTATVILTAGTLRSLALNQVWNLGMGRVKTVKATARAKAEATFVVAVGPKTDVKAEPTTPAVDQEEGEDAASLDDVATPIKYEPPLEGDSTPIAMRPLANLGYACLNVTLRGQKPTVFNNRTCRLATLKQKGLEFVSGLALQNCRDLLPILKWNHEHNIKLFRLSSDFFPWGNVHYSLKELPDYEEIKAVLAEAGQYARETGQRLTSHPCEFVKLAGQTDALVDSSMKDLELHSEMFDLLGFEPSPYNKINIHVGGTYGDKDETLLRFAENFRKLSPNCRARMTVENDDRPGMFSVKDLLVLHDMVEPQLPIVFDFHHYRFNTGGQTAEEAFKSAIGTWPPGVKPIIHWSESQGGKRASAHSDYIGQNGRMQLFGLDAEVDVMIESKAKELALLLYRDIAAANSPSGREPFFTSIDVIEEEAARAEEAKAAGTPLELEPEPSVYIDGTEIIPVNDKRLHGRSQRRNKSQAAARARAAKAAAAEAKVTVATEESVEVVVTTKRKRKTKAEKAAEAMAAAAAVAAPAVDDAVQLDSDIAAAAAPSAAAEVAAAEPAQKPKRKRKSKAAAAVPGSAEAAHHSAAAVSAATNAADTTAQQAAADKPKDKAKPRKKAAAKQAESAAVTGDATNGADSAGPTAAAAKRHKPSRGVRTAVAEVPPDAAGRPIAAGPAAVLTASPQPVDDPPSKKKKRRHAA